MADVEDPAAAAEEAGYWATLMEAAGGTPAKDALAADGEPDCPVEDAPAPNIHGETMAQCSERTGYTVTELAELFPPIERWPEETNPPLPDAILSGFAADRFAPPPLPYTHPRVYFGADDLPAIRSRLADTPSGRAAWRAVQLRTKWWTNDADEWAAALEAAKAEGYEGLKFPLSVSALNSFLEGVYDTKAPFELFNTAPLEAFRVLIDEDEEGGKRMATVGATMAEHYLETLADPSTPTDWQPLYQKVHSETLGLVYDFIYNYASDEQRDVMRRAISAITTNRFFATAGTQALPAFPAISSNWLNVHTNLLPITLAIEGEEGYDHDTFLRLAEGWKKWVHVAHSPVGAPFEGLAKSNFCAYYCVALAKRGVNLFTTSSAYNFIANFHLAILLPSGRAFCYETGIGPMSTWSPDAEMLKMAYPNDGPTDIVFRAGTGMGLMPANKDCGTPAGDGDRELEAYRREIFARNAYVNLERLYRAFGASDFVYGSYEEGLAALREMGHPRTYFCDQRGLYVTRNEWSPTAAMLYVEPRHTPGGHSHPSRGDFVFCALGRVWGTRWINFLTGCHSLPLIDGLGQGGSTHVSGVTGTVSGRTVEVERREHADFAFIACDLSDPYRWAHCLPGKGEPLMRTPNDSRMVPSPLPWMNLPWSELPNWRVSTKGGFQGGHSDVSRHLPMRYFFRTAGLARGDAPYALIVDDLDASGDGDTDGEGGDDALGETATHSHSYEWLLQIDTSHNAGHREPPLFVRYETVAAGDDGEGASVDMLLYEGAEDRCSDVYAHVGADPPLLPGARVLRVRVLEAGPDGESFATSVRPVLQHFRSNGFNSRRVVVPVRTVGACRIKVLLCPQHYGDPAPVTQLTRRPVDEEEGAAGAALVLTECSVRLGGTVDKYAFALGLDGRTRLSHAGREEGVGEADAPTVELLPVLGASEAEGEDAEPADDVADTCAGDGAGSCADMLQLVERLQDTSSVCVDGVSYGGRSGGDDPESLLSPLMGTESPLAKIDSYVAAVQEPTAEHAAAWRDEVIGVNRIVAAVKGAVPYVVIVDDVEFAAHAKGERHAIDVVIPLVSPTARLTQLDDSFAVVEDGPRQMAVCSIFPDRATLAKPLPEVTWPVRLEWYLSAEGVQAKRLVVPSLSSTSTMSAVALVPLGAFGVPTCTPLGPEGAVWIECGGQRDAIQVVDDGSDDSEHCGIILKRLAGEVLSSADEEEEEVVGDPKVVALNATPPETTAEDLLLGRVLLRADAVSTSNHECGDDEAHDGEGGESNAPERDDVAEPSAEGTFPTGTLEDVTGQSADHDMETPDAVVRVFPVPAVMSLRGFTVPEDGGDVMLPLSSDTLSTIDSAVTFSAWMYAPHGDGWRQCTTLLSSPWLEVYVHYGSLKMGARHPGESRIRPLRDFSAKLPLGVWFHLTVEWEESWGIVAYLNAKRWLAAPGPVGCLPDPDTPLAVTLGSKSGFAWDDVRVFGGRLDAALVRQLFLYSGGLRRLAAYPLTTLTDGEPLSTPALGSGPSAILLGGTGAEVAEDDDMGTCLVLDASTRLVVPGSVTQLALENCLSVSVWLRFDVDTWASCDIFRLDAHAQKDCCLHVRMRKVGPKMRNQWGVADGRSDALQVPQPTGEWRHYVQTYDSGTVSLYLDGELAGARAVTSSLDMSKGLLVANGVVGAVKGLAVFNYALTPREVEELYQDTGGVGPQRGHLAAFTG